MLFLVDVSYSGDQCSVLEVLRIFPARSTADVRGTNDLGPMLLAAPAFRYATLPLSPY